jgi:adenylosuccinate synthase
MEGIEFLRQFTIVDSEHYINKVLKSGKSVLAEGAQGTMLDIDFGTYPFVTSSNTITAGTCTGLGVAPTKIGKVIGIFKAYCTRVGSGPFPTELLDEVGEKIRQEGREFGSTTGRPRRCGWIDIPQLKYAIMINGVTELSMMKADILSVFDTILICTHYKVNGNITDEFPFSICDQSIEPIYQDVSGWNCDLTELNSYDNAPKELKQYVSLLEDLLEVPITIVSVGPDRSQTLITKH